jgi:MATE family multidrug resistance protein
MIHRRILKMAGPIVLSNATVPLLGAVDTAVVGHMGSAAPIAAVGLGSTILMVFYWAFGFLRMSTSGLAAQAKGGGADLTSVLMRALLIGVAGGGVVLLAHPLLFAGAFALAPATDRVEDLAATFLTWRILAAPAAIGLYAITGFLIGVERGRAVLALQLWQNGINLVLVLTAGALGWGVAGVAASTTIAEISGFALGLWLVRGHLGRPRLGRDWGQSLTASRDILIRTVILQLSFTTFTFLGAGQGETALAANQILLTFLGIMAFALDGFAHAAETLVGQAIGAKDRAALREAVRASLLWGHGGAALLAAALALGGWFAISVMTTDTQVQVTALGLLPFLVAAPVVGAAAWIYDGIFIGALEAATMRQTAIRVALLYAGALAILLPLFGNPGLWAALMLMNAARGGFLHHAMPRVMVKA